MAAENATTIDPEDAARFSAIADEWWDPDGKFKPLHRFNPIRLHYIRDRICTISAATNNPAAVRRAQTLDVGCGGGLISEPLARMGAKVTGIDASDRNVRTAQVHAEQGGLDISYHSTTVEEIAAMESARRRTRSRWSNTWPTSICFWTAAPR